MQADESNKLLAEVTRKRMREVGLVVPELMSPVVHDMLQ